MGNLDVITSILVRVLGLDALNVPAPVLLLGFTLTVMWATFLVWVVWTILRFVFVTAADLLEMASSKQRIVIARGLTRHDFEQVRKGIKAWRLLLVRHGSDDYLRHMAGESDRQIGRTRHDVINMKLALSAIGEVTLSWKLPVHKRLGSQFRCFAVVRDAAQGSDMLSGMLQHYDEIDVLAPETPHPARLYFLLKRFRVITAADGMKQNFVLPE